MPELTNSQIVDCLTNLIDGVKRLENAVLSHSPDDIEYYVSECKRRRIRAEKIILDSIGVKRG